MITATTTPASVSFKLLIISLSSEDIQSLDLSLNAIFQFDATVQWNSLSIISYYLEKTDGYYYRL